MIFGLENNQMSQNQQLSSIQSNHNYIHQTLPLFSTNYPPQTNPSQNFGHQLQFNQQLKPFQLKFNLSPNSLQCFIAKPKAQKFKSLSARLAKQSKSEATLKTFKLQLNKLNPRNDNQQIKSQTQRLNVEQNRLVNQDEDQLSTILSNQIIHQIEKNGIKYNWKDKQANKHELNVQQKQRDEEIEQLFNAFSDNKYAKKSFRQNFSTDQSLFTQNSNNQNQQTYQPQANLNNYSSYQGFQYNVHPIYEQQFLQKSFQKNYSMASTNQPYASMYYQQINAYQMQEMSTIMSNHHYNGLKSLPSILFPSGQFIIRPEGLGKDPRTTLMIKNIPNKYTIQYLSQEIDQEFSNYYDFLYLPCDTKSGANQGYGFINFIDLQAIKRFYQMFHGKKWRRFRSQKICNLTYARLQGINSLIEHFQNSKVLNHKEKKYQPIIKKLNKQIHILIKEQQEQQGLIEQ